MKIGLRTPSVKKRVKARTTGKIKRKMKKAVNPLYGKKGMGFVKNPERSVKSAIYRRTTFSVDDVAKAVAPKSKPSAGSYAGEEMPLGQKVWFVILMLFLFFPVGYYLLWKNERLKKNVKIIIACVFAVLIFASVAAT